MRLARRRAALKKRPRPRSVVLCQHGEDAPERTARPAEYRISTGPYAVVRHPMYLGVLLFCLGSGPLLGSWWAALPLATMLPVFVRRTLCSKIACCKRTS
jgi:hypothetical protein